MRGTITPGNIVFQKELDVNAHTTEQVKFDKRYFPQLCIDQPRLWWPNGYGEPNLYHCKFEVMVDGRVSETKDVSFGINILMIKRAIHSIFILMIFRYLLRERIGGCLNICFVAVARNMIPKSACIRK